MASKPKTVAGLNRLGLSPAALAAAIEAELGQNPDPSAAEVARAVAGAIDANNGEILRQLTEMLRLLELPREHPRG
jgi:hypothetical protein